MGNYIFGTSSVEVAATPPLDSKLTSSTSSTSVGHSLLDIMRLYYSDEYYQNNKIWQMVPLGCNFTTQRIDASGGGPVLIVRNRLQGLILPHYIETNLSMHDLCRLEGVTQEARIHLQPIQDEFLVAEEEPTKTKQALQTK